VTTPEAPAPSRRDQLRALISELAVVHGDVILASGARASYYVDLRRITLHHRAAPSSGT
jgi:orotate phosphoribosyltransferase